ncbi:MAG TPA: PIG-L family deacetylase [Lacunisphaera sp.]|nr:PIG-L family deacetylase [Lacunisphaera sp.]
MSQLARVWVVLVLLVGLVAGAEAGEQRQWRILVIGGHPDDPETCAGGLLALAAAAGHDVTSAYLTTGEAGIPGTDAAAAAAARKKEAERACGILGVKAVFLGEIDGATVVDKARYAKMAEFLREQKPDLVITHWPIDAHPDHRACWNLVFQAWLSEKRRFALYYMEAMTGHQSMGFLPTDRVDIGAVVKKKHEACFAHVSQGITPESYEGEFLHGQIERFRGGEARCEYAEAFVRQDQSKVVDFGEVLRPGTKD